MNKQPPSSANQPPSGGPSSGAARPASPSSGSYRAAAPPGAGGGVATRPLILRIAKATHVGKVRDHQEDALEVIEPAADSVQAQRGQLLIVADGMGGHNAGEVASQMAVQIIRDTFYGETQPDLAASLRTAMSRANEAIFNRSRQNVGQTGMGTTAVIMAVRQNDVQFGSIGDSRAYVLRNGKLAQVTSDHSWVEEQVRAGVLTPEQARLHPQRNVITRALGTSQKAQPEFFNGALNEGDVFLLCSDGLTTHVTDAQIQETLQTMTSLDQAVNRLVAQAIEGGGSDNISVIVARAENALPLRPGAAPLAPTPVVAPAARRRRRSPALLIGGLIGSLAGVALVAFTVVRFMQPPGPATPSPTVVALTTASTPRATTDTPFPTTITPSPATALTATPASGGDTPTTTGATSTLAPTPTTAPPPTKTPTSSSSTPTPPLSGGTPTPLPAPVPTTPQDGADVTGSTRFVWDWAGQLAPGQAFEVRIWREGNDHPGAAEPTTASELRINVDDAAGVRATQQAAGDYWWTVAVVRVSPTYVKIGNEAPPRRFKYTPQPVCSGGACEK